MGVDITIAVLLGVLAAGVSGLAGHLAATKSWHKWFFWGSGLVMVILIFVQAVRTSRGEQRNLEATNEMQNKLDQVWASLNHNPVKPQVQTPLPSQGPLKSDKTKASTMHHRNPSSREGLARSATKKHAAENNPPPKKLTSTEPAPSAIPPETNKTNPQPSSPPPTCQQGSTGYYGSVPAVNFPPSNGVLKIVSESDVTSTRADAPCQTEIIVQSSVVWQSVKLAVQCNGDLVDGRGAPSSGGMTVMVREGLANGHPNMFLYEYQSASPPFGPADPLQIEIWSKSSVSCNEITTF